MSFPYELRALQIDLGRQMETMETLQHLVDLAARFSYNALHLYLEGRVRTPSFQADEADSYSLDEMRELVAYADRKGLTVIPQVNCFSHAEQFLAHESLQPLSELREGREGRFGGVRHNTFCPSLEGTRDFLARYLAEVAEAFPGPWFHVGLDEVWEMGLCSACQARLEAGETLDDLFSEHLRMLHGIVDGFGKRMMMWDDMFEDYPQSLAKVPTDIVQCIWQYDPQVTRTRSHFGRRRWDDRLAVFERRGIDYLLCPADWTPTNASSFTRLAAGHQPFGGLMTVWEKSQSFMLEAYPTLAFAGKLWESGRIWDDRALFAETCTDLFGCADPQFTDALMATQMRGRCRSGFALASLQRGPLLAQEVERESICRALLATLQSFADSITDELGCEVLRDILIDLRIEWLSFSLRRLVNDATNRWSGQPAPPLETLIQRSDDLLNEARGIQAVRHAQWARWRPGLASQAGKPIFDQAVAHLEAITKRVRQDQDRCLLLTITYALPDYYGSQQVRWQLRETAHTSWQDLGASSPKPVTGLEEEVPYYTRQIALPLETDPDVLQLETWGYGGIGIMYLEIVGHGRRYVPAAILETEGLVEQPDKLLAHDSAWTTIGETETEDLFHDSERARQRHRLQIQLAAQ